MLEHLSSNNNKNLTLEYWKFLRTLVHTDTADSSKSAPTRGQRINEIRQHLVKLWQLKQISRRDAGRNGIRLWMRWGRGRWLERQRPEQQQWQMENKIKNLRAITLNLFQQTCILQTDCDSHHRDRFSPNHSESVPSSHFCPLSFFKATSRRNIFILFLQDR